MWLKAGVITVWLFLCVLPIMASAHASPISYTPSAGSTQVQTPSSISIRFTERIEMGASSLRIFGPSGVEVQNGKGTFDPTDDRVFWVPINNDGEGVYAVSWQVVSVDDGHFTKGAYSFLVSNDGKIFEGVADTTPVRYSTKFSDVIFSFLNLCGETLLLAVLAFILLLLQPLRRRNILTLEVFSTHIAPILKHVVVFGLLLFCAGNVLAFISNVIELSTLQEISVFAASVLYAYSSVGLFLILKVSCACIFAFVFFLFQRKILVSTKCTWVHVILIVVLIAIVYMQSYISHAAASFFYPQTSVVITFLHLFSKELIIGLYLVLLCIVIALVYSHKVGLLQHILQLFDRWIAVLIGVAGLSGAYIIWLHLKHPENLFMTDWGVRCIMLLCSSMVFGAFLLWHTVCVHPHLTCIQVYTKTYLYTLCVQVCIGFLVLFFSGYISMTTPPFVASIYSFSQTETSEGVKITLDAHPYEDDSFRITLTDVVTHAPVEPTKVVVSGTLDEKNIGPNLFTVENRFMGGYVFKRADLTPLGTWKIVVAVQQNNGYDADVQFTIVYPEDVERTHASDIARHLDTFALWFFGIGIGVSVFSGVLFVSVTRYSLVAKIESCANEFNQKCLFLHLLFSVFIGIILCGAIFMFSQLITESNFKSKCLIDGHLWQQAFPTLKYEAVGKNSFLGCTVHDGHYHFVDNREYDRFMVSFPDIAP